MMNEVISIEAIVIAVLNGAKEAIRWDDSGFSLGHFDKDSKWIDDDAYSTSEWNLMHSVKNLALGERFRVRLTNKQEESVKNILFKLWRNGVTVKIFG